VDTATGIFLIAVGAILKFAINASVSGISIDTVGVILMIAGATVLLFGLFFEARWADRRRGDRVVVEERVEPRA
jgi:hypothetical protein